MDEPSKPYHDRGTTGERLSKVTGSKQFVLDDLLCAIVTTPKKEVCARGVPILHVSVTSSGWQANLRVKIEVRFVMKSLSLSNRGELTGTVMTPEDLLLLGWVATIQRC